MSLIEKVKLTHYSKGGGWACKIGPGDLAQVLSKINKQKNDNVIVDFKQSDDAAVIDIGNDKFLVQTVDYVLWFLGSILFCEAPCSQLPI